MIIAEKKYHAEVSLPKLEARLPDATVNTMAEQAGYGDSEAAYRLLSVASGIIYSNAIRYAVFRPSLLPDLVQEGAICLLASVSTWSGKSPFLAYFALRLRGHTIDFLREKEGNFVPTPAKWEQTCVDIPLDGIYNLPMPEPVEDTGVDLTDALEALSPVQKEIIKSLYGIGGPQIRDVDLAKERGVSRSAVSFAKRTAIEKLRRSLDA